MGRHCPSIRCCIHELQALHPDVSPATLARSLAQLTERGLTHRHGTTLFLSTQNAIEAIRLAGLSPGGLPTLRVLATPTAYTIVDELLAKRLSRRELSQLGPAPRVSDALKNLELLGAIQRDGQLVLLLEPTVHREILDLVDQILGDTHQRAYREARTRRRIRAANAPTPAR